MKRIIYSVLISGMMLVSSAVYANSGALFNVLESGNPAATDIILCLDAKALLSCQRYHATAQNLAISTAVNRPYPNAGVKILTSGYEVTACTRDPQTNYCLFATHGQTPTSVTIQNNTPATHTAGGTVSGLVGSVSLQNNGGDTLTRSTDGSFTFPTSITEGNTYHVTVSSQPATQTCTVNHGSGTMGSSNVTNIQVTCSTNSYTVGGTISGLVGSVSLQNNSGDTLTSNTNGSFNFSTSIAQGSSYNVTVSSQPATQTCTVSNSSGTMGGSSVSNIQVTCSTNRYTVGGTISGLVGSVSLQNNGGNTLTSSANGSFTFSTPVAQGGAYMVTVSSQPVSQTCTVSNDSGTMGGANITNVDVNCVNNTTTLSVDAMGIIPVNNGSGSLTITNTGTSFAASNVSVSLPSGWTGVTQDASNCASIAPNNGTCTITFTTTTPYVAQGNIHVIGDNISNSPTTALAFTVQGYLVWEITNASTVQVIDNDDQLFNVGPFTQWGGYGMPIGPAAQSLTDGIANTNAVVSLLGANSTYPAGSCNQSTNGGASVGDWYLPAICQIGVASPFFGTAGCSAGLPNIYTNLVQLGFSSIVTGTSYWSSTVDSSLSATNSWAQGSMSSSSSNNQMSRSRTDFSFVRCARSLTY